MFKKYDSIFVGWIDLDESKWTNYGYKSLDEWKEVIKIANTLSMPQYFQKYMPNKKITTALSVNDVDPQGSDLYIKFSNVKYIASKESGIRENTDVYYTARGESKTVQSIRVYEKDVFAVTIDFIDVKEQKNLYTVSVLIKAISGSGYYGMRFENRINNAFYNTVAFIDEKLKKK